MKTGLIVEGGGMKCAYSAAVLDAFLDEDIKFDYCIGVSAGSANALSYLAGQRGRNKRFYTDHIHEKGYFGLSSMLRSGDLFGLDYIYSTLTNSDGGDPLDFPKIEQSKTEYELVVTNAVTGQPEYHSKEEMKQDDYEWVKASCALPAACKPRMIDGTPYYDGGVSDPIPCDHALEKGCDKLVVILSKPRDYEKKPEKFKTVYSYACRKYPKIIRSLNNRHVSYMKRFRRVFELEKEGKVFVIAPSKNLPMSTFAMDSEENQKLYDLGMEDFEAGKKELQAFIRCEKTAASYI